MLKNLQTLKQDDGMKKSENITLKQEETRPNEFRSMTARKDGRSPVKSISCYKKPQKGHKRPQKAIQYQNK